MASAAKALARRKAAAGREREAAALVAAKARDARSDAERRLARLKRVEAAVRSALASRAEASSSSDPLARAAEEVTALGDAASDAWRVTILRWSAFAREKIASVAMGYVTVVDAACESASELAEELAAEIADVLERERARGGNGTLNARNHQTGGIIGSSFVGGDYSPGGGGAGGFLNGLLEDAAAGFASRAGGGAESSSSPVAPAPPPPGSSSSSSSSAAAASTSHHTMKDAFRAQSTKALKNLAGGLGSAAGKIQETFQSGGGALGALGSGWALGARRFGGRGDHGSTPNDDAHRGDEPSARRGGGGGAGADANAGGPPGTTTTTAIPAEDGEARSLTGGPTTAAASPGTGTGTGIPGTGTPGAGTPSTRVQRAVAEARADLARLEARRDALAARKRRMRALLVGGGTGGGGVGIGGGEAESAPGSSAAAAAAGDGDDVSGGAGAGSGGADAGAPPLVSLI